MKDIDTLPAFDSMEDKSWWWFPYSTPSEYETAIDLMAALASLSGMLDDAETDQDLREAAEHGWTLLHIGTITAEQISTEADRIDKAFMAWGDKTYRELVESN